VTFKKSPFNRTVDEKTGKQVLACPIYRLMNTQDYKDTKVEIYLEYNVIGIYALSKPMTAENDWA